MAQKTPTSWRTNPAAFTNAYTYDSATYLYDSASQTYDGIVTGEDPSNDKTPTAWAALAVVFLTLTMVGVYFGN